MIRLHDKEIVHLQFKMTMALRYGMVEGRGSQNTAYGVVESRGPQTLRPPLVKAAARKCIYGTDSTITVNAWVPKQCLAA